MRGPRDVGAVGGAEHALAPGTLPRIHSARSVSAQRRGRARLGPVQRQIAQKAEKVRATPRRLRAARFSVAPVTASNYAQMAKAISLGLKEILEREDAPASIWRWVAYGKFLGDRYVRLALALSLRRPAKPQAAFAQAPTGWAYPRDVQLGVAESLFLRSPARAKLTATRILPAPGKPPSPEHTARFGMQWQTAWEAIETAVQSLDLEAFLGEVNRLVALKPKRKVPQRAGKPKPRPRALTSDQAAAMKLFRMMITGGSLPLDVAMKEMSDDVVKSELSQDHKKGRR